MISKGSRVRVRAANQAVTSYLQGTSGQHCKTRQRPSQAAASPVPAPASACTHTEPGHTAPAGMLCAPAPSHAGLALAPQQQAVLIPHHCSCVCMRQCIGSNGHGLLRVCAAQYADNGAPRVHHKGEGRPRWPPRRGPQLHIEGAGRQRSQHSVVQAVNNMATHRRV